MKALWYLFTVLVVVFATGCGWHRKGETSYNSNIKRVILISSDPHGPLSRAVRAQLRLNNIKVVSDYDTLPEETISLRLGSVSLTEDTVSLYHAHSAELQLTVTLDATVLVPGRDIIPIHLRILGTRYKNFSGPLADSVSQESSVNEIYEKAAERLVRRLQMVCTDKIAKTEKKEDDENLTGMIF